MDPGVEVVPQIMCKCGKRVYKYYREYEELLKSGADVSTFFQTAGLKRMCCINTVRSPAIITTGSQWYNLDVIEGRASLDQARTSAVGYGVTSEVESAGGNRAHAYRTAHNEKQVVEGAVHVVTSRGIEYLGGEGVLSTISGEFAAAGENESELVKEVKSKYGKPIVGIYTEPVLWTGKVRIIPGLDGKEYKVEVLKPTLRTYPLRSTQLETYDEKRKRNISSLREMDRRLAQIKRDRAEKAAAEKAAAEKLQQEMVQTQSNEVM